MGGTTEVVEGWERLAGVSLAGVPECLAALTCEGPGWEESDFTRLTSRHRGAAMNRAYIFKPTARLMAAPPLIPAPSGFGHISNGRGGMGAGADSRPFKDSQSLKMEPVERIGMDRLVILSKDELARTLDRLASQVLEVAADSRQLVLLGIPTRGVALAGVLAARLEALCGHPVDQGSLDPTFHRDDLARVGTRLVQATDLPADLSDRHVLLVDDVIFTGRTVRAALEALQAWGRPRRVSLLVMVDRGHRELPIQPDFCGRLVPTSRQETIQVCLLGIDGEDSVLLLRP
jgi:Pyrimidine operon attenuation protein/uracil phosphoribosyltransferase